MDSRMTEVWAESVEEEEGRMGGFFFSFFGSLGQ
jgi:hypothetical protein